MTVSEFADHRNIARVKLRHHRRRDTAEPKQ
jgi:hypothetical protein